jgi:hypothetical protein
MKRSAVLRCILLWAFFLPGWPVLAQQPVQINTIVRPPYTLQLSDYYASTHEKLTVVLTNRDLNKPVLNVRLRMTIESQSVQLRSREFATLPTLQLEAGMPMRLSLSDLAPYLSSPESPVPNTHNRLNCRKDSTSFVSRRSNYRLVW